MPTEFNSNAELSPSQPIYPTQADTTETFAFTIDGTIFVGTRKLIINAPYNARISSVGVVSAAGSGTFTIKINDVNVTGLVGKAVSTTEAEYEPTDLNLINVDQDVSIEFVTVSSLTNFTINIDVLRETGVATVTTIDSGTSTIAASALEILSAALPAGFLLVDIPFGTTKLDENNSPTANYAVTPQLPENLAGDSPTDRIGIPTLVGKTSTGITLLLNAAPTTGNSIFRCTVATAAAASFVVAAGSASGSGSGGDIATTSFPLRGDASGNAIAVTRQTGDAATGLATLNLFSSTPTYDADKLVLTDVTTNNASITKHGFLPKLPNDASKVLDGTGAFSTPTVAAAVATDAIWDAKGDLAVGTGANTAAKLTVGANNTVHVADSAQTTGTKWANITDSMVASANKDGLVAVPSMRTLGTGAQQAAAGNDARITGGLLAANALSEINSLGTFDDARVNLNFGDIVYFNAPAGGAITGQDNVQSFSNKTIDADLNPITNLTSANFRDSDTVMELVDPGADRGLLWDDSAGEFAWATGLTYTGTAITGINGVTDASSAAAGDVGQVISSLVVVGSPISLTTATAANITSISLTAGDWDVTGNINLTAAAATSTAAQGAIHTTSATLPVDGSEVYSGLQTTTTSYIDSITIPRKRVNVSVTTTVYLVAKATFSAGTVGGFGGITARRVR